MELFSNAGEFLGLFGIDAAKPAAEDFEALADLASMMQHYPQYRVTVAALAELGMRQRRLSAKVYWSRMKRTLRPIMEADPATLRALGLAVDPARKLTCPELARLLAERVAELDTPAQVAALADLAAEVAASIDSEARPKSGEA